MMPRLTCFYLKLNKQEIGKKIQTKILGVFIGYEQILRNDSELCFLLLWSIVLKNVYFVAWHQQEETSEDFTLSFILDFIQLEMNNWSPSVVLRSDFGWD